MPVVDIGNLGAEGGYRFCLEHVTFEVLLTHPNGNWVY